MNLQNIFFYIFSIENESPIGQKESVRIQNCFCLQQALLFVGQKVGKKPGDFELAVRLQPISISCGSISQNHRKMLRIFKGFLMMYFHSWSSH
jgi:hypothetical protein